MVASLLFTIPGVLTIFYDLRRRKRIRFSLAHGIFLVTVLYRLGFKAARIDAWIWDELTDVLEPYRNISYLVGDEAAADLDPNLDIVEVAVPLLTMVWHMPRTPSRPRSHLVLHLTHTSSYTSPTPCPHLAHTSPTPCPHLAHTSLSYTSSSLYVP